MQREDGSSVCDGGRRMSCEGDITGKEAVCGGRDMVCRKWKDRYSRFPEWGMEEWVVRLEGSAGTGYIRSLNSTLRTTRTFGRLREAHVWKE